MLYESGWGKKKQQQQTPAKQIKNEQKKFKDEWVYLCLCIQKDGFHKARRNIEAWAECLNFLPRGSREWKQKVGKSNEFSKPAPSNILSPVRLSTPKGCVILPKSSPVEGSLFYERHFSFDPFCWGLTLHGLIDIL